MYYDICGSLNDECRLEKGIIVRLWVDDCVRRKTEFVVPYLSVWVPWVCDPPWLRWNPEEGDNRVRIRVGVSLCGSRNRFRRPRSGKGG